MLVYLVSSRDSEPRVSLWQKCLFQGDWDNDIILEGDEAPLAINSPDTRSLTNLAHSGRIVPEAWVDLWLHVSPELRDLIQAQIPVVQFREIAFKKLVDVDLTYDTVPEDWNGLSRFMQELPHHPDFEIRFRGYSTILRQFKDWYRSGPSITDWKHFATGWGDDYSTTPDESIPVSETLLKEYPLVSSGDLQVREDLFAILAPHLDPDFTAFSVIDTDRDPVLDPPQEEDEEEEGS